MICMIKYRTKQRYSSLNAQCTTMNTIMPTNKSLKRKKNDGVISCAFSYHSIVKYQNDGLMLSYKSETL